MERHEKSDSFENSNNRIGNAPRNAAPIKITLGGVGLLFAKECARQPGGVALHERN